MTAEGWICHYRIPSVTAVPEAGASVGPGVVLPSTSGAQPVSTSVPISVSAAPVVRSGESAAAERLMLRCAEATWVSLCTPGERRQARELKAAAGVRAGLRLDVTRLLSERNCDEAVRVALVGGDLDLAREARDFCQPVDTARVGD